MFDSLRRLFKRQGSPPAWPGSKDLPPRVFVVDDRVFLLGLDYFYREPMKRFEAAELLPCARSVAAALRVRPATGPVEGYYADSPALTEYFQLMRALQEQPLERERDVQAMKQFRRLLEVTSSPAFGRAVREEKLFPAGRDPLSQALLDTSPEWTVPCLVDAAHHAALSWDDYSLVGLAARIRDPVVLTALRESVVVYTETITLGMPQFRPVYEWRVSPDLVKQAERFIREFHRFVPGAIPAPSAENAQRYYEAFGENDVAGRCVRIGKDPAGRQYHWAIHVIDDALAFEDFWSDELWTTQRYRAERLDRTANLF
jgi:hypothetical protein